jgi:ribosomal protein S17
MKQNGSNKGGNNMSITIKRNTGWQGMSSKIQIEVNGEKADSVMENNSVDVELPDGKAHIKVTQFGIKSNEIAVKEGDIIRITSTRWIRMSFPLVLIIFFLTIFLPNLTYGLTIFFVLGALIVISIFLFNGFHLSVFDRENR